jgi:hypothetical protein
VAWFGSGKRIECAAISEGIVPAIGWYLSLAAS